MPFRYHYVGKASPPFRAADVHAAAGTTIHASIAAADVSDAAASVIASATADANANAIHFAGAVDAAAIQLAGAVDDPAVYFASAVTFAAYFPFLSLQMPSHGPLPHQLPLQPRATRRHTLPHSTYNRTAQ